MFDHHMLVGRHLTLDRRKGEDATTVTRPNISFSRISRQDLEIEGLCGIKGILASFTGLAMTCISVDASGSSRFTNGNGSSK